MCLGEKDRSKIGNNIFMKIYFIPLIWDLIFKSPGHHGSRHAYKYFILPGKILSRFNVLDFAMSNTNIYIIEIYTKPWVPPETESQSGRGRGVRSETPVKVKGVCSRSVGQGKAWTSRFPHYAAPMCSHSLSAWSSEYGACHVELPAEKKHETEHSKDQRLFLADE